MSEIPKSRTDHLAAGFSDRLQLVTQRLRRWFLYSAIIGVSTGLLVAAFESTLTRLSQTLSALPLPLTLSALLLPIVGMTAAGFLMSYTRTKHIHGTEEVVKAYHQKDVGFDIYSAPLKLAASLATIGFGGSAGLEGPSIHIGAAVAGLTNRLSKQLKLETPEMRGLIITGAAAGIAAIFKAPFTGIIFALEVPFKDDLAKESLIPALVASVSSYFVFVSVMGITPLFQIARGYSVTLTDLALAASLGLVVGAASRLFVKAFRLYESYIEDHVSKMIPRMALGGLLTGLTGLASVLIYQSPISLGVGYGVADRIINQSLSIRFLAGFLFLKAAATIATLGSGGVGGIFIPMILMGGATGAIFARGLGVERGGLYPLVGMSSFLAAGYKTPLAAVAFVAETTGSPHFIMPALVATAFAFMISGRVSVSRYQRWYRLTKLQLTLLGKVSEVMTEKVVTVPAATTLEDFFAHYVIAYRLKSLPVVDTRGGLYGMVALSDINTIPPGKWPSTTVAEVAERQALMAFPDQTLAETLDAMNARDIDRVPVVSRADPTVIVGVIASKDIIAAEDLTVFWREHGRPVAG